MTHQSSEKHSTLWDQVAEETGYDRTECKLTFYKSAFGIQNLDVKSSKIVETTMQLTYRKGGIGKILGGLRNGA